MSILWTFIIEPYVFKDTNYHRSSHGLLKSLFQSVIGQKHALINSGNGDQFGHVSCHTDSVPWVDDPEGGRWHVIDFHATFPGMCPGMGIPCSVNHQRSVLAVRECVQIDYSNLKTAIEDESS